MHPICVTCGVQLAATEPPDLCPICTDERQFVGWEGQRWTTLEALQKSHRVEVRTEDKNLTGIGIEPQFGIGQRALLVRSIGANVLWDCTSLVDRDAVRAVRAQGGLDAIAISHPHFYTGMVEWSRAFGGVPIYLHGDDRGWLQRPDQAIVFWQDYPACPNLADQRQLLALLDAQKIGVELGDEGQLWPEQSTSAIVLHHPQARYFNV